MHILITNDDGVTAPGLLALAQAMRNLGRVTVLAPNKNWSASGHVKTLHKPLRLSKTHLADGSEALTTDGAPSDCVALALLGILDETVDLVVSGINPAANIGHDLTYSGTVTAAMEAAIWGLPGIAVSADLQTRDPQLEDFETAALAAARVVEKVKENGLPEGRFLSVNVPHVAPQDVKGFAITRQGMRVYRDELVRREDPQGRPYYWIGGDPPSGVMLEDTDFWALGEGMVSVTPLQLDLTDLDMISKFDSWDLSL